MRPKVIINNEISIDGSIKGFDHMTETFYKIAGRFGTNAVLVGSKTAKSGIEMFSEEIPNEKKEDMHKPEKKIKNIWFIPDSTGRLKDMLHVLRQSNYCDDIVIFVSKKTSLEYLKYLEKREYDYFIIGEDKVDLDKALETIYEEYDIEIIRTDCGHTLNTLLLEKGLVDKISLVINPSIVGKFGTNIFKSLEIEEHIKLTLDTFEEIDGLIWLMYKIDKDEE